MLLLLAIPVVVAVTFVYRLVQTVAPSNILIARVRAAHPTLRRAGGMAALACALVALAHGLATATAGGMSRKISSGVSRKPPPTPKSPEMKPTAPLRPSTIRTLIGSSAIGR